MLLSFKTCVLYRIKCTYQSPAKRLRRDAVRREWRALFKECNEADTVMGLNLVMRKFVYAVRKPHQPGIFSYETEKTK